MKRPRVMAYLVAAIALIAYQGKQKAIYAASEQAVQIKPQTADTIGAQSYIDHCAICHGEQREGILPTSPPLLAIKRHLKDQQIVDLIHYGRGRMPAFPKLQNEELSALLHYLSNDALLTSTEASGPSSAAGDAHLSKEAEMGGYLFQQSCAFCHGRDATGGETGPDLTRSKLVITDTNGDKITEVVRIGRPEKKMPAFNFSNQELLCLASFIHAQGAKAHRSDNE